MNKNIKLHHKTFGKLIRNENITENGIYTYLCLKPFAISSDFTYLPISVAELNSVISNVDLNNAKQKNCITTGFQELEQVNLIKIISNNKYDYKLDFDGMVEKYSKDNPYTVYNLDAFTQALKDCGNKKTIFKCLSGFFYELTHNKITADTDGSELPYFNATREELAERCGIDVRSLDKYLDILQKNKIIYVYKYNYKYRNSGKQLTNAYGLYKNKDKIESECDKYIDDNKDIIYPSSIPRGKGSKKQKEEKKAQYTPVEADEFVVTDEELAEHDKRHKELYAKRMKKAVMTESVSMQEVDKTVQADSKDFDTIIAERKAETNAILSDSNDDDSNKEVETDDDDSSDKYTKEKEKALNMKICLDISPKNEAIRRYKALLKYDDPFGNYNETELVNEFADTWDEYHEEEEEENPFA